MKAKQRVLAVIGAVILGLGGAVAVASPALAIGNGCPYYNLCLWKSSPSGAQYPDWNINANRSSGCINMPGYMNDHIKVIKLDAGGASFKATVYKHSNCTGTAYVTVYRGQYKDAQLSPWDWYGEGAFSEGYADGSSVWYQHSTMAPAP